MLPKYGKCMQQIIIIIIIIIIITLLDLRHLSAPLGDNPIFISTSGKIVRMDKKKILQQMKVKNKNRKNK